MVNHLDRKMARGIIDQLGATGTPPAFGVRHFTVGLENYLEVLDHEYLNDYIAEGGSAFKLVKGIYGGGKTHFLYSVRDLAWEHNYAVAYTSLSIASGSPFYKLDLVFASIVNNLWPPLSAGEEHRLSTPGIAMLLKTWYERRLVEYTSKRMSEEDARQAVLEDIHQVSNLSSTSFKNALVRALEALHVDDEPTFERMCQWMKGEMAPDSALKRLGITQKIDGTTAFSMLRSLGQAVRQLDFTGLVVLFDEAEQVPSLNTRNRELLLNNLRELVDECGKSTFAGVMVYYAVPDLSFLDGRAQVYEALRQRLSTVFEEVNFTGVRIDLDDSADDESSRLTMLREIGNRIVQIYQVAFGVSIAEAAGPVIAEVAAWAHEQRFGDSGFKRDFVKELVRKLHGLAKAARTPVESAT